MKKFIIALFTLLLFQNCCFSAEWIELYSKTYVDIETFKKPSQHNNYATFWIKSLNDKSNYFIKQEKEFKSSIWYQLEQWDIDCSNRKYNLKELIIYDTKGSIIDSFSRTDYNWQAIPPGTVSEVYYKLFCKY
jgi:hypothetical protein